ncbi:MAG TPA: cyclic nucleotide-binding domain-containing protein [Candidatus Limnocylindrales bacterium]|nr:cyclic nucleotide-binding domain-containing protein [Candidatus Limnocylindrales bacterium]
MAVVDDLAELPPFALLERDQLGRLAKYAEEIDVPAGTELTHEGRHEGSVYVVVSGSIGIERGGRMVDTIHRGDFFGEIAAIDGGPRTATGRALEDTRVVVLSPRQLNEALDDSPELRAIVMAAMEERLARIDAGT